MRKKEKVSILLACLLGLILVVLLAVSFSMKKQNTGETPSQSDGTEQASEPATTQEVITSEPTSAPTNSKTTAASGEETLPTPVVAAISQERWYLALVNRDYKLPEGFTVELADLVPGSDRQLDARCAPQYTAMYNAGLADGVTLTPFSGHRRHSTQATNYNNKVQYFIDQGHSRSKAEVEAAKIILPPGTSEHELGLAMDIVNTETSFENTKEFKWLREHAADYGFILRYPKDKQDITKITYEPWHWRYVGVKDAKAIKESGKCLEEYLGIPVQ